MAETQYIETVSASDPEYRKKLAPYQADPRYQIESVRSCVDAAVVSWMVSDMLVPVDTHA